MGFGSAVPTATGGFEQVPPLATKWATPLWGLEVLSQRRRAALSKCRPWPQNGPPPLQRDKSFLRNHKHQYLSRGGIIKSLGCLICTVKHDGIISGRKPTYIIIRPSRYRKEIIPAVGHAKSKHRTLARILWGSGGRAGLQAACQLTCGFAWFVVSKTSQELLSRRCGVWRCGPPATSGLGDGDGDCGDCD